MIDPTWIARRVARVAALVVLVAAAAVASRC